MIVDRIYQHYERQREVEPPRFHLGASEIGIECERRLWLTYRWCVAESFSGQKLRLFDTGKREEFRLLDELKAIGVQVQFINDDPNLQHRVSAFGGHFGGSLDAIATHIDPWEPEKPYVLEFKTHGTTSFNKLKKEGVETSKHQHYVQMQIYMGLTGTPQAIYLAVHKDKDELYEEVVEFNQGVFDEHMEKAKRIITSPTPPSPPEKYVVPPLEAKLKPRFEKCMYPFPCPAISMCYEGVKPSKSCRSCVNSMPSKDGQWFCNKHGISLDNKQQLTGCNDYTAITLEEHND